MNAARLPARGWLALGVAVLLLAVLAVAVARRERVGQAGPALSMHATDADGGRALALWLAALGYRVEPLQYLRFALPDDADAFLLLAPRRQLSDDEAAAIQSWVERGGTALVAHADWNTLLGDLGLDLAFDVPVNRATPLQPVFDPPVAALTVDTDTRLFPDDPAWVPLLAADGDVIAAEARVGAGRVVVLADEFALSNHGLASADNAAFVLHALRGVPRGGTVVFDEYHHGLTEHGTFTAQLRREPWGWALLWAGALVFLYLALAGRRFGRAVPPAWAGARRSSAEYVGTMATMLRRGGHGEWLRAHYLAQAKRRIGTRYGARADQPASALVAEIARRRPEAAALAAPLTRLESLRDPDEATVVALMRDVDRVERQLRGE